MQIMNIPNEKYIEILLTLHKEIKLKTKSLRLTTCLKHSKYHKLSHNAT